MKVTERNNISNFAKRIAEEGIVVLDDITDMPVYGEPFISHDYVYCINHSGVAQMDYNMQPLRYDQHDIAVIYPQHILMAKSVSPDYRATLVVVSADMFRELGMHVTFRNRFRYEKRPAFPLNDSQYECLMSIIGAMRSVSESGAPSRRHLMVNMLEVLLEMTNHFRQLVVSEDEYTSQRVSSRFYEAVIEHHCKHHSVSFYAEMFCFTPKYFSDIIRRETGQTAKYWISSYLVISAKKLLLSRTDLNIQQIGELLGYEDQTSFCRQFRKTVGISPSSFRNRNTSTPVHDLSHKDR